mgnify:CR=1 FL=1
MQKFELVSKILKDNTIQRDTIKYYGLDYPKVFNNFRCSSITDTSSFSESSIEYDSNNELSNKYDKNMFNILTKRSKLKIITFWEKNKEELQNFENKWSNLFYIYCKKTIEIPYNATDSLIYHLFSGDLRLDMKEIHKIMRTMDIKQNSKQKITIMMVEPKYKESDEKLEILEFTKPCIHVTKNSFDTYQTGCIYFCENSLRHLEYQNLNNFLGPWMRRSRLMFLTIRNYIFNTFTCNNYQHLMLFSSIVLYILGQRAMNDLDMIIYQDFKNFDKLNQTSINNISKFPFIDCSTKGTNRWKHYWNKWLEKWANHASINSFEDVVYDSNNHFYFFGIKIISIDLDISRRILRNRPASITDLYMLKENLNLKFDIPKIDKRYKKYINLEDLSEEDISLYIKDGYVKKKKELVKKIKIDNNVFLNKILSYLKHRYKHNDFDNIKSLQEKIYSIKVKKIRIKIKKLESK